MRALVSKWIKECPSDKRKVVVTLLRDMAQWMEEV